MAHDLASLITVLEQYRVLDDHKKAVLLEKATSLRDLLEKSVRQHRFRGNTKEIIQKLQSEIRDAAHEAEDIIESHAVDQKLSEPEASRSAISLLLDHSMSEVMEKFDAANDKLASIINKLQIHDEEETTMDQVISDDLSLSFAADPTSSKMNTTATMVGFKEDTLQLKHRLTSKRSGREIIPIVGMGGIGKTTLARNLYNDPLVVSHFDARAWVTVSQDYSVRAILLGLLSTIFGNLSEDTLRQDDNELGGTLYRRLYGRRYLIVLDDIWSEKAWDEIQRCFPKEENRSRILITSRELDVAKHADSACEEHQMHLLSDDQGWDLLRQKVFEEDEHYPPFLEEIGRKIASNCGGLPLAISVIGGLLSVEKHSKDLWDRVARDVRSITGDHTSDILCLSYENLPLYLKPCFLYMSAFPEDYEVRRSILVKLLVAEGFLWRKNKESLEDVAEEYLKALVDRNLLSVTSTEYDGRAKSYGMHDLLRDICVRKAEEEKFLHIFKNGNVNNFRRVSVQHRFNEDAPNVAEDLSCSRSLLYISFRHRFRNKAQIPSNLRLVRVWDAFNFYFDDFSVAILKLANIRSLAVSLKESLPSALWKLRNLQTLMVYIADIEDVLLLPYEAWEISSLRHIIVEGNGTISIDFKVSRVHENLQTVSGVCLHDLLGSNLINNIPNTKKLVIDVGIRFVSEDRIIDLSHMQKLETLKLKFFDLAILSLVRLPDCLKKISFRGCTLPMGLVNGIGDLQYLQVLKIEHCHFQPHEEWELNEGVEFCSLQLLELRNVYILRWKADYSHFPRLRHLKIRNCDSLEEIPACFAEMSTLETIEVDEDQPYLVDWANEVRETQRREYGNETLQIRLI